MTRDERQDLNIENWKKCGGRATLLCCTGYGKTTVALKLCHRLINKKSNAKIIVVVPSEYLQGQWLIRANKDNLSQNITVLVINSAIRRYISCDLLIVDEVHMALSETFIQVFNTISHKLFLGLTATLNRLDGRERLLLERYPICDTVTLDEAIANGWAAKYKHHKVEINTNLEDYDNYTTSFLHHFSFFDYQFDLAMACVKDAGIRAKMSRVTGQNVRDIMIHAMGFMRAMSSRKTFIADHPSKIIIADKIIRSRQEDNKILTFTKHLKHAQQICCGEVYHGGLGKKAKAKVLNTFTGTEYGVLNTCKAFDVGVDIPGVSVSIIISGDSSEIVRKQRNGRSLRYEGEEKVAEIWSLILKGTVEQKWFEKSNPVVDYEIIQDYQLDSFLLNGNELKESEDDSKFLFTL